jgi:hypothetical protein
LVLVDWRNCLNSISFEESKVLYTWIGK